jgi:hypothetical protein
MKKQYAIPLVLFLLGMVITIIEALFKIMHWPGANFLLSLGLFSEAAAIIVIMIAITKLWK